MGILVMVLGPSGSGKTTSLRNFQPGEAEVFCVTGKPLPFRTKLAATPNAGYRDIYDRLTANESLAYVIDDSTYLMQFDNFARAKVKGYDKFTEMALSFEFLLRAAAQTSPDTVVYFLHHPQFGEDGSPKPQTIGKMLDNQLCVEGLFSLTLEAAVEEGRHVFRTNAHGIAKSPMGMLDSVVDNDLRAVDSALREYWGLAPLGGGRDETQR